MNQLETIVQWKRNEIKDRIRPVREWELVGLANKMKPGLTFAEALVHPECLCIIAEMKRRSPSAGTIDQEVSVEEQIREYYNAGANALSILTDEHFFGGHLRDLCTATDLMAQRLDARPCLRKDFTLHPIQILEAAEAGARAVLLIVGVLDDETIKVLYEAASLAALDVLFEVHDEQELERALNAEARIIGVNNRDLTRFTTDLSVSERLLPQISSEIVRISESGIHSAEDAYRVRVAGADAVLVGEAMMKAKDKAAFIQSIQSV